MEKSMVGSEICVRDALMADMTAVQAIYALLQQRALDSGSKTVPPVGRMEGGTQ
jgi:hypothetical protein